MSTTVLERPVECPAAPESPGARRQRCSELIRLGAQYHPQGRGALYNVHDGSTCALGALMTGLLGPSYFETIPWSFIGPFGITGLDLLALIQERTGVNIDKTVVRLPMGGTLPCALQSAIVFLNDYAHWTYDEIATWLASMGL